ncbi:MAG: hypothetical protein WA188_15085 [Terriglobales bacterium]
MRLRGSSTKLGRWSSSGNTRESAITNTGLNRSKDEVERFLDGFKGHLSRATATLEVKSVVNEAAFAYEIVLKKLHEYLSTDQARPSDFILAEKYKLAKEKFSELACGSPTWEPGHPFHKSLGTGADELYARWKESDPKGPKSPFAAVCPDLALLAPYRIVFECKYFNQPANQDAVSQLVHGLYEAFFYRAMPTKPLETRGLAHGWDYEYSCLLAYDATENRRLRSAWDGLPKDTRDRFWEDANIYVLILPEPKPGK